MIRFTLRRLLVMVPIAFVVTFLVYAMVFALHGDPILQLAGDKPLAPSVIAAKRAQYHLDQPLVAQYWYFMTNLAHGHLGTTFDGQDIATQFKLRWPVTIKLGLTILAFQWTFGLLFGIYAGWRRDGLVDRALLVATLVLLAVPSLVAVFFGQVLFGVKLHWFPVAGVSLGWPRSYLLPAMILGLLGFAALARLTRTSVVEVASSDFVKTARAKGLGEQRILWRHVLRNAMLPVMTYIGLDLAGVLGGSVITEGVFNMPGMGNYMFTAIGHKEGTVVVTVSMVFFVAYLLANLLVDIAYGLVDPRVRNV